MDISGHYYALKRKGVIPANVTLMAFKEQVIKAELGSDKKTVTTVTSVTPVDYKQRNINIVKLKRIRKQNKKRLGRAGVVLRQLEQDLLDCVLLCYYSTINNKWLFTDRYKQVDYIMDKIVETRADLRAELTVYNGWRELRWKAN